MSFFIKCLTFVMSLGLHQSIFAAETIQPVPKLGSGELIEFREEIQDLRYQIGSEWGKVVITQNHRNEIPHLNKVTQGTVRIRGATGFYLGKYGEEHLFATNHHVCPRQSACLGSYLSFSMLGTQFQIDSFLGSWPTIDLALMTARIDKRFENALAGVALPFDFDTTIYPGQKLLTVGYGVAGNPSRQQVGNWDQDCIVFSANGDYRLMRDPDQFNPGSYETWSFANGCDVSHGDSGSAMIDRETGRVVGIIWTGKIPKSSIVQDSDYLSELLAQPSELIWTDLSYAVPVEKIGEFFDQLIQDPNTTARTRDILIQIRAAQSEN